MTDKKPMTVTRLTVDSFQRLRAAHVTPTATGLVPVRGRNAQGKSSLIEAMLSALLGRKASPDLPISEGAHKADVVVDLGELVVHRRWTRDASGKARSALTVTGRDGSTVSSPQAVLDALVGQFADPVAFLAMRPADQVKTVLAATGMDVDLARLEADEARVFELRRDAKRDADAAAKRAESLIEELRARAEEVGVTDELLALDTDELLADLDEANRSSARHAELCSERATSDARCDQLATEIAELKSRLAALSEQLSSETQRLRALDDAVRESVVISAEPIKAKLREVETAHELRQMDSRAKLAACEAGELAEVAALRDDELAGVRASIQRLLADADFPVDGMSYDLANKQLLVGGIPFSQASQAERLRAAAAVAMAGDSDIRVLFAREGSLLDADSQRLLAELAAERGYQLWLEVVDADPHGPGVWIEDGQAWDEDAVEAAEMFNAPPRDEVAS